VSAASPFSLRIFVADGDPDGLRVVERSNWIGKALVFPRALLSRVKTRDELGQTGVYLLLGPRDDGDGEMLYIGEGDPIRPRLESHHAQKDFWNRAACFVAAPGQLNKAHVQFLEANLVRLAKAAKRLPLDNGNSPTEPTLSEADRADMQVFLENMLGMLPVLGIHAFEQVSAAAERDIVPLYCRGKGVEAEGYESSQGFVIKAGSGAVEAVTPAFGRNRGAANLRNVLISNGVLVAHGGAYRFSQDYAFTSPSAASDIVLGGCTNGRTQWKNAKGQSLKELQAAEARG
jgi:hypothetical protein